MAQKLSSSPLTWEGTRHEEKVLGEREFSSARNFSSTHRFVLSTSFMPSTVRIKRLSKTAPALYGEGRYKRIIEFGFNPMNSGEVLGTSEPRSDNSQGMLLLVPTRLLWGSGVEHGVQLGRTWGSACWKA